MNEGFEYIMIFEYYSMMLSDIASVEGVNTEAIRDVSKQLTSVFEFLWRAGILLPNISLKDIATINGQCKLVNIEGWKQQEQANSGLNRYYLKQLYLNILELALCTNRNP